MEEAYAKAEGESKVHLHHRRMYELLEDSMPHGESDESNALPRGATTRGARGRQLFRARQLDEVKSVLVRIP